MINYQYTNVPPQKAGRLSPRAGPSHHVNSRYPADHAWSGRILNTGLCIGI